MRWLAGSAKHGKEVVRCKIGARVDELSLSLSLVGEFGVLTLASVLTKADDQANRLHSMPT
jgi:hypothetical protein